MKKYTFALPLVLAPVFGFMIQAADWPMLGGSPSRNLVNNSEKNLPSEWSVKKDSRKGVKWAADLGTVSYGGPVVSNGLVID